MITAPFTHEDGHAVDELHPVTVTRHWLGHAEGSVLMAFGRIRVLYAASFIEDVPRWRRGSGKGWVTTGCAMLPRTNSERSGRGFVRGKVGSRTHEVSHLISRNLRGIIGVAALGENAIILDCDVPQADGGTRATAITGAYMALTDAVAWNTQCGLIETRPGEPVLSNPPSTISVGTINGVPCLGLPYEEDVRAQTDMNVVQTGGGRFTEAQGTAKHAPFNRSELGGLLDLVATGNSRLAAFQRQVLIGPSGEPFTVSPVESSPQFTQAQAVSAPPDTDGVAPLTDQVQVPTGARLTLATHNAGKLTELRQILTPPMPGPVPEFVTSAAFLQAPGPVKDSLSSADNALLKARVLARATGLPAVADDPGLCVDALGRALEIFSAHWSGRHGSGTANLQLLLNQLGDATDPHRDTRFTCAAALVRPASGGQAEQVTTIERFMEGRLVHAPQGEGGSGYDPTLVPAQEDEPGGWGCTTAQMTSEEKHAISHRGQAFHAPVLVPAEVLAG